jgi:membrane associated rhomboid family serine protease
VAGASLDLFAAQLEWYRGRSGVLHALFAAGAVFWLTAAAPRRGPPGAPSRLWPALLLAAVWTKVLVEQHFGPGAAREADWLGTAVARQAHLFGAISGTATALALGLVQRLRRLDANRGTEAPVE